MKWFRYLILASLMGCIGEDILLDEVDPVIRLTNPITSLEVNTSYQFEYMFLDDVGMEVDPSSITWESTDESIMIINNSGVAQGVSNGTVTLNVRAELEDLEADTSLTFDVTGNATMAVEMSRTGTVATTSSYPLRGAFTLTQDGNNLVLQFGSDYVADTRLPGLYVYLTNNPNSPNGGIEIGKVMDFNGVHQYTINDAGLFDYDYVFYYCKPFNVKVGHGAIN